MKRWKHIFKLDPAKNISDEQIKCLCSSGTDAIMIGGTDRITYDKVYELFTRVRPYQIPIILEISTLHSIVPSFDYYFIPMVMNSREKKWMMDIQHQAIKQLKPLIHKVDIFFEGYCILNEDSKAFQKTNCVLPTEEDVLTYAYMAEHVFSFPYFYMEYSGMYGDPDLVKKVKGELCNTLLIYGGGIKTRDQAKEMAKYADMIIVGNSIYTDFNEALATAEVVKGND